MQKLATVFSQLDPMRRILVVLATVGAFAAVLAIARGAGNPTLALLYSGLDPAAAGEVIASLDQMGVTYEVRGPAIFVEAARRDSLRMTLASEGKPAGGSAGYEILDNLTGFGTTSQMFDAAYWRAKEGELARTILANPQIRAARVHISTPPSRSFGNPGASSASVMITTAEGGLAASHAKALKFLVASAVAGLTPEQVTVIDSRGGLVASGDEAPQVAGGDRAAELRQNVERLVEARVGYGRAVVEVNVDTITDREQIVERRFDPDSRVAISTVTQETTSSASDTRDGAVTVAGNLPDGEAGAAGANSSSSDTETREQVNYEVSETTREVHRAPGAVRRLSVAVLVDGIRSVGQDGTENWSPRPEEEIEALRDLVASAVGFDADRGDVITIRSMEFPPVAEQGTEAAPVPLFGTMALDVMQLVQLGVLALVSVVLGLFVVRPILTSGGGTAATAAAPAGLPAPERSAAAPAEAAQPALPPLSGEIDDGGFMPQMAVVDDPGGFSALPPLGQSAEDPAERPRRLIDGRQAEAASILQSWMEDGAETA